MIFSRAYSSVQPTRKDSQSNENIPRSEKMHSATVMGAAETLTAMQQTQSSKRYLSDQTVHKENVRGIHIIENIKLDQIDLEAYGRRPVD